MVTAAGVKSGTNRVRGRHSVTRLSNLLEFGQLFKAFGNN